MAKKKSASFYDTGEGVAVLALRDTHIVPGSIVQVECKYDREVCDKVLVAALGALTTHVLPCYDLHSGVRAKVSMTMINLTSKVVTIKQNAQVGTAFRLVAIDPRGDNYDEL